MLHRYIAFHLLGSDRSFLYQILGMSHSIKVKTKLTFSAL